MTAAQKQKINTTANTPTEKPTDRSSGRQTLENLYYHRIVNLLRGVKRQYDTVKVTDTHGNPVIRGAGKHLEIEGCLAGILLVQLADVKYARRVFETAKGDGEMVCYCVARLAHVPPANLKQILSNKSKELLEDAGLGSWPA